MSKYTHRQGATAHPEYMLDFLTSKLVTVGGVFDKDSNHFLVEQQSVADMTVKVTVGTAFLFKAGSSKVYPVYMDAVENVTIGANSSGSTRNDAIVMYVNLGVTANTDATNVVQLVAIQGVAGGSAPSDADIETAIGSSNPYIRLANVEVVNGATSIVTAKITDTRVAFTSTLTNKVLLKDITTPSTPASGQIAVYSKGEQLAFLDSSAVEHLLGGSVAPTLHANAVRTGGNITKTGITSAYADIGNEFTQTITALGGLILINVNMSLSPNVGTYPQTTRIKIDIGGTAHYVHFCGVGANYWTPASFSLLVAGLSAGSQTIKVQVGYNGTDSVVVSGSSDPVGRIQILEFPL